MRQISFITLSFLMGVLAIGSNAYAADFAMTTSSFQDAGPLPTLYTCDSTDVSPDLSWTNPPDKTTSFAVTFSDPDAPNGTFYHWIVYNLPKTTTSLDQGVKQLPTGALFAKNDFGKAQYNGPCPPKGSAHTYTITLYALDNVLSSPAGSDAKTVMKELSDMKEHILKQLTLTAIYSRWAK